LSRSRGSDHREGKSAVGPGAIRGGAPYPITGEELVNNISILEAIITSAARDGEVVKL
jgi:hypothetical protein